MLFMRTSRENMDKNTIKTLFSENNLPLRKNTHGMKFLTLFDSEPYQVFVYEDVETMDKYGFVYENFLGSFKPKTILKIDENTKPEKDNEGEVKKTVIPKDVDCEFPQFKGTIENPIRGLLDSGADASSIHGKVRNQNKHSVTFTCPMLSDNEITMHKVRTDKIRTSDSDGEDRPVIQLDIKLNGKRYQGVLFNINDRSDMEQPVLLGVDFMRPNGIVIDPYFDDEDNDGVPDHLRSEKANKDKKSDYNLDKWGYDSIGQRSTRQIKEALAELKPMDHEDPTSAICRLMEEHDISIDTIIRKINTRKIQQLVF